MVTEAAGAGQYLLPGTSIAVPRIQIVSIEQAMALRDRAVRLPLARENLKRAAVEPDRTSQGKLNL